MKKTSGTNWLKNKKVPVIVDLGGVVIHIPNGRDMDIFFYIPTKEVKSRKVKKG